MPERMSLSRRTLMMQQEKDSRQDQNQGRMIFLNAEIAMHVQP